MSPLAPLRGVSRCWLEADTAVNARGGSERDFTSVPPGKGLGSGHRSGASTHTLLGAVWLPSPPGINQSLPWLLGRSFHHRHCSLFQRRQAGLAAGKLTLVSRLAGKCPGLRWRCWDLRVSGAAAAAPGAAAAVTPPAVLLTGQNPAGPSRARPGQDMGSPSATPPPLPEVSFSTGRSTVPALGAAASSAAKGDAEAAGAAPGTAAAERLLQTPLTARRTFHICSEGQSWLQESRRDRGHRLPAPRGEPPGF